MSKISIIKVCDLNVMVNKGNFIAGFAVILNGALFVHGWKLFLEHGAYNAKPPLEKYTDKNGRLCRSKSVIVLDEWLNKSITKLAVSEYARKHNLLSNELDTI